MKKSVFILSLILGGLFSFSLTAKAANTTEIMESGSAPQLSKTFQVHIESPSIALAGYQLQLEIRDVNDSIYHEEFSLDDIAAGSSKSVIITTDALNSLPSNFICGSNLIGTLKRNGEDIAENRYIYGFNVDSFLGIQVLIQNLNHITLRPTVDAAGTVPLNS